MGTTRSSKEREARFAALYATTYGDVLRFVQRRTEPHRAEDVTHEAFMAAWRRLDDLPREPGDARAWLYGTARNCLLNDQRSRARQGALEVRIASHIPEFLDPEDDLVALQVDLAAAWSRVRPEDREVLSLAVWENLTSPQAGRVLGISAAAYRIRLHRARQSLHRALRHRAPDYSTLEELI